MYNDSCESPMCIRLRNNGYFINKIDYTQNRNDTLKTDIVCNLYNLLEFEYKKGDYTFVFSEFDNLMVTNDNQTLKQTFDFLTFIVEDGYNDISFRYYISESKKLICLVYEKNESGENKLVRVLIESPLNPNCRTSYYNVE